MEKPNRGPPSVPEDDDDGLIPRDDPLYAGMQEEAIDAYRSLARSWIRYERSKKWRIRLLRKLGFGWIDLLGFRLKVSRVKCRLRWALGSIDKAVASLLDAIDGWIDGGRW